MTREYLTRPNFKEFVRKEGALYIDEDGQAVFKAPPGLGYEDADDEDVRAGLLMNDDGEIEIGTVRLSCDNWESTNGCFFTPDEAEWVANKILRLVKYKGD